MLFKTQIKISNDFGVDHVRALIGFLKKHINCEFLKERHVEPDLIFVDYLVNGKEVSFMTEGMDGTSVIGHKSDLKKIISLLDSSGINLKK